MATRQIVNYTQTTFTKGQLSPKLQAKVDNQDYYKGVKTLTNGVLIPEGGIKRRFGMDDRVNVGSVANKHDDNSFRLVNLLYADGTEYLIAFVFTTDDSLNQILIYKETGTALTLLDTLTVTSYTYSILQELDLKQGSNILIVSHETITPHYLHQATSETDWLFEPIHFENLPVYIFDNTYENATFAVSATALGNNVQLTIPGHKATLTSVLGLSNAFTWDGTRYQLAGVHAAGDRYICTNTNLDPDPSWPERTVQGSIMEYAVGPPAGFQPAAVTGTPGTFPANNDIVQDSVTSNYYIFNSLAHVWNNITNVNFEFSEKYIDGLFLGNEGTMRLTQYDSVTQMTGTVLVEFKNISTFPGSEAALSEPAWTKMLGYPSCAAFYDNRLFFAGSPSLPAGLWGSKAGADNYFDFDESGADQANFALAYFINTGQSNIIKQLLSSTVLSVFTTTGVATNPPVGELGLTATNLSFTAQNKLGIKPSIQPVFLDGQTIYVDNANRIQSMQYDISKQSFTTTDISFIADPLVKTPKRLFTMQNPDTVNGSFLFVINTDGTMAIFQSMIAENVGGWSGFESTLSIVEGSALLNDAYVITKDALNNYRILKINFDSDFDMQGSQTLAPSTTITGLTDYANQEIGVKADGFYAGTFTVSAGGEITGLPFSATNVSYGYEFSSTIELLPVNIIMGNNSMTRYYNQVISTFYLDYVDSLGLKVNGEQIPNLQMDVTGFNDVPTPQTGYYPYILLQGSEPLQTVTITHAVPFDFTIRGVAYDLEITK